MTRSSPDYRRGRLLLAALALAVFAVARAAEDFPSRVNELLVAGEHPWLGTYDLHPEVADLRTLYTAHAGAPLWERGGRVGADGVRLLEALADARAEGLVPEDYEVAALSAHKLELEAAGSEIGWAEWDVALSTVALRYARHLHGGRIDPRIAGFDLGEPRPPIDLAAVVERIASSGDLDATLAAIEPPFRHYHTLKVALAKYRALAAAGELAPLPAFTGPSVKPGAIYEGAAELRRRLALLGDLPETEAAADVEDGTLTKTLAAALTRFQQRHGLDADGALGANTLRALNTPLAQRIRQIELTMERWRWLAEPAAPPIIVNIPQFLLFAFRTVEDREDEMLTLNVVVGQVFEDKRTPVFLGNLAYVVFRPYWNVTPTIARREVLPAIRRDPGYLRRNHMELVGGQTDESPVVPATPGNLALVERGGVRIRQRPGPDNALGEVKFMLPNAYNVYLHSTPARGLFQRATRAFSHGCIRVSDPLALAEHVMRNAREPWSRDAIVAAFAGSPNQRVDLEGKIPVLILYGTAVATEAGRVFFLDDLYGYDRDLETLLELPRAAVPDR